MSFLPSFAALRARLGLRRGGLNGGAYVCIQPLAQGWALAELAWSDGRARVLRCEVRAGDPAHANLPELGAARLGLMLPFEDYRLIPLDAPAVPDAELMLAARWLVKDQFDVPLDDLTLDLIRLDPQRFRQERKLLVVAAHNAVLRAHVERVATQRRRLCAIDIPEMAQRNLAALLPADGQAIALLALTPQGGLLTVSRQGELCFLRHIELRGSAISGSQWAVSAEQIERVGLELQRSIDYIERQHGDWRIDTIHLAPIGQTPDLAGQLGQQVSLPVRPFPLTELMDWSQPIEPDVLAHGWFALGGALRREA